MKNLIILLAVLFLASCADPIDVPSTFTHDRSEIVSYKAFRVVEGEFVEADPTEVPPPDLSLRTGAMIEQIFFKDESSADVTDGFGTEEVTYTGRSSRVSFNKDGQRIELDGHVDGNQFTYRSIHSGDFDGVSINTYISAICGDIVNCIDIDEKQWLSGSSWLAEGSLQYVIVLENTLVKE